MPPQPRKPFSFGQPVDEQLDNGLRRHIPVVDAGGKRGELQVTLTDDQVVQVIWKTEPGSAPISRLEAWSDL